MYKPFFLLYLVQANWWRVTSFELSNRSPRSCWKAGGITELCSTAVQTWHLVLLHPSGHTTPFSLIDLIISSCSRIQKYVTVCSVFVWTISLMTWGPSCSHFNLIVEKIFRISLKTEVAQLRQICLHWLGTCCNRQIRIWVIYLFFLSTWLLAQTQVTLDKLPSVCSVLSVQNCGIYGQGACIWSLVHFETPGFISLCFLFLVFQRNSCEELT